MAGAAARRGAWRPQAPAAGPTRGEPAGLERWSQAGLGERGASCCPQSTHQGLGGPASEALSSPAGCLTFVSTGHSFPRDEERLSLKREDSRRSNHKNSGQRSLLCCSSLAGLRFKKKKQTSKHSSGPCKYSPETHNLKKYMFSLQCQEHS